MNGKPYPRRPVRYLVLLLCLLAAGCGVVSVGVSNSPEWCPNPKSAACP